MASKATKAVGGSEAQLSISESNSRRFERYNFRALATATIHPASDRAGDKPQVCYVLTNDLSRGGLSILHPRPLSHRQQIDLLLADGRQFTVAVQWTKRLDLHCYCMGCRFVAIAKS